MKKLILHRPSTGEVHLKVRKDLLPRGSRHGTKIALSWLADCNGPNKLRWEPKKTWSNSDVFSRFNDILCLGQAGDEQVEMNLFDLPDTFKSKDFHCHLHSLSLSLSLPRRTSNTTCSPNTYLTNPESSIVFSSKKRSLPPAATFLSKWPLLYHRLLGETHHLKKARPHLHPSHCRHRPWSLGLLLTTSQRQKLFAFQVICDDDDDDDDDGDAIPT